MLNLQNRNNSQGLMIALGYFISVQGVKSMINIRPVSDLRSEKEYNEYVESELQEAEEEASDPNTKYYSHDEMKKIISVM